jgi:crotonobetainyl-CoA:carnitine CoA-transferase CaiB-like acyl-CoA transferase
MFGWLGEPEEFANPAFDTITARVAAAERLDAVITELFAPHTGAELVEEAARRGVPLAQVLTFGEALRADHFTKAGTVADVDIAPGMRVTMPVSCVGFDGERLGFRRAAPLSDAHEGPDWTPQSTPDPSGPALPVGTLPFTGLRVLDLGVIVFGAEVGRAFADLGADVIKVESIAFPDGLRQTRGGESMNASFAWGQRNKRSLGLDLRCEEGRELFLDLAAKSDVVLSNFKPGTLDSLGIGRAALTGRSPGIVVLESAAFHSAGPWARRLGYGPLVRAASGVSSLWRYTQDEQACWDGVTVFPDHVAAKVAALAVTAALLRREDDGRGAAVEVGQSDVVLHQLASYAAWESFEPGSVTAVGNRGRELFGGVFACAGDDDWCVVEARTEAEVAVLAQAVSASGGELETAVSAWTAARSPHEVMERLQPLGLPAAAMLRLPELLDDPQLADRGSFTRHRHPALDHDLPTERVCAPYAALPDAALRPAPAVGEHTRAICRDVLGLDDHQLDDLLARGVVHQGCD